MDKCTIKLKRADADKAIGSSKPAATHNHTDREVTMPSNAKRTTIQQLAEQTEVSERKLRRVTRSLEMGVGRGKRYGLTSAEVKAVKKVIA